MNLHGLVRGVVGAINPDITATLIKATGYTTGADGKQTATSSTTTGPVQVQHASGKDIERMNNLGIQGVFRSVYLFGNWTGIVRADQKGGDILQFPEMTGGPNRSWRIVNVAETYPDWSKVIVWMQQA